MFETASNKVGWRLMVTVTNDSEHKVYLSKAHPSSSPKENVFAWAVLRPLAFCTIPVMILSLVRVLQGLQITGLLVYGFPVALLLAIFWTRFQLKRTLAEIHVLNAKAAARTIWDALQKNNELNWLPVVDLRKSERGFTVTIGDRLYDCSNDEWFSPDEMLTSLQSARRYG